MWVMLIYSGSSPFFILLSACRREYLQGLLVWRGLPRPAVPAQHLLQHLHVASHFLHSADPLGYLLCFLLLLWEKGEDSSEGAEALDKARTATEKGALPWGELREVTKHRPELSRSG